MRKRVNFREYILGGQDGLVNVLGLVLGVAGATLNSSVVIISGLVATIAESISMAAVAYTSSRAAKDYYKSIVLSEKRDIQRKPEEHKKKLKEIYSKRGFKGKLLNDIVRVISKDKKMLVKSLLTEEGYVNNGEYEKPLRSSLVVGFATIIGSMIPILPFFFLNVKASILASLILVAVVLFFVGALKARLSIGSWKKSRFELMVIGIIAALVGYGFGLLLKVV